MIDAHLDLNQLLALILGFLSTALGGTLGGL